MNMSNAKIIVLPRGVLSEVAARMQITRQAVWAAWHKERPDVVDAVEMVVREFLQTRKDNEARLNRIAESVRPSKLSEAENIRLHDKHLHDKMPEQAGEYFNT